MEDFWIYEYNSNEKPSGFYPWINVIKRIGVSPETNDEKETLKLWKKLWNENKARVRSTFIKRLSTTYPLGNFAFVIPVSSNDFLVKHLRKWIKSFCPNALDLSDCFEESNEVCMAKTTGTRAKELLKDSLTITKLIDLNGFDELIIIDDIYNTGSTIEVYKELLSVKISIEKIKFGTIIKIINN